WVTESVSCTFKPDQTELTDSLSVETIGVSRRNVDTRIEECVTSSPPSRAFRGPRWPSGKVSALGPEGSRFETRFRRRSAVYGACCTLNHT
ncbi:hypothetical protein AVEN_274724-1, partial [Araneus ventricosus]